MKPDSCVLLLHRHINAMLSFVALAMVAILLNAPARGATEYWDTSAAAGLQAGSGNWSTSGGGANLRWSTAITGTALTLWANGSDAVFQTNGTSLISLNNNGITANSLTFNGTGYTIQTGNATTLTLVGSGTITTNANATISAILAGSVGLTKLGASTLTLSGTNTYTGTTTISAGTLQIGSGGTSGTLGTGSVVDNATLAFNRSDSVTVANAISGSGALNQNGSGTTILTASNTYAGTTTINAGTLQIGDGGTTGTLGTGNVVNNATLAFNRSNTLSVGNTISGSGALNQNGSGTTILTGTNTYTGATRVNAGTLLVNGSTSATSAVTVDGSGTTLGGTGTIGGAVTLGNTTPGAIVNPGPSGANGTAASVGTLTTGALTLASSNKLHIDAFGTLANNWDQLVANGVNLGTVSTLELSIASGLNFAGGTTYILINNTSASNLAYGTFSGLVNGGTYNFSGYDFMVDYFGGTGNDFTLTAVPEPGTWATGAFALAAVAYLQRRRLRSLVRTRA